MKIEDQLSSLLPNLDQDLANLEANLGGLNFDEFDFDLGGNNTEMLMLFLMKMALILMKHYVVLNQVILI